MSILDTPVVDRDEYGQPVSARYRRLGADAGEPGLFVRFEPGFGLNVHIGYRQNGTDTERMSMDGAGWEALCRLVDEWRVRQDEETTETPWTLGMRETEPSFCWRLLAGGNSCCVRPVDHEGDCGAAP